MLGFLTQTFGNAFATAPDFFLAFRRFRPNSILRRELWSGTAAWAGPRAGIWRKLCCLQELEGLNPETAVVWAVMERGSGDAQHRRWVTENRLFIHCQNARNDHFLCLSWGAGKGISVLYSGKVLREPLLLCVGDPFPEEKWNSLKLA